MTQLLVIGGTSTDVLHLKDRTVACAGGAGMYTAMAARRCGAQVALFGPRPDSCPEGFRAVAERLTEWLGPPVPLADLPRIEISYRQGTTEYLNVSLGAEATLSPTMLPADLSRYAHVHVTPLADPSHQLSFVQACRERGAQRISAGTYLGDVARHPEAVRALIQQTDCFFLNRREARALFGSVEAAATEPGKVFYVTLGAQGARIIQGEFATSIPAASATELDPTGAGDTFCGATLAYLLEERHPIMAARHAISLAAEMIGQVGPTALLSEDPPPGAPLDTRVQVNDGQVRKVAERIVTISGLSSFPFVGPEYPPVGHPQALDYFFAATLQQFGFWTVRDGRYDQPLIAPIGGVELKGSDYLWQAFRRRVEQDADFCSPEQQASLSREELLDVFRADNGADPMPALDLHLEQAHDYGRDMVALQLTPQAVLQKALKSARPSQTFMVLLDQIGGYKEDALRKKSALLALILHSRPERFLPIRNGKALAPIVDYHLMRSCLRVGLIDVTDGELSNSLINRQILLPADEWAVRYGAYRALEQLEVLSGKSPGTVNAYLFGARKRCPEMSEPECQLCELDPVCAHRKELFQPVLRTTFY